MQKEKVRLLAYSFEQRSTDTAAADLTRSMNLPFPGFYYSWIDADIDYAIENMAKTSADDYSEPQPEFLEAFYGGAVDFPRVHFGIAKEYVDAFRVVFREHTGCDLPLRFEVIDSPKEYNFETDRLFAFTSPEAVRAMFDLSAANDHRALAEVLRERHTSCSGFVSHYSPDLATWLAKPLENWDHNELGSLVRAIWLQESGYDAVDRDDLIRDVLLDDGGFESVIDQCTDYSRIPDYPEAD